MSKAVRTILEAIMLLFIVFAIVITIVLAEQCYRKTNPPVEEIKIDSLTKVRDSLIIQVNNIDSIKNAEIIKVKELDNDSTLELFYKLIRE